MNENLTHLQSALTFALLVALSGLGVCAIALLTERLLRRRSEPLRYGILFSGVIGLLVVPLLVVIGQSVSISLGPEPIVEEEVVRVPAHLLPGLLEPEQADAEQSPPQESWMPLIGMLVMSVWIIGMSIGLVRLALAMFRQSRILLGQRWSLAFGTDDLKARLVRTLGLSKFPEVYRSPVAPMPMVVGFWRPVIVVPETTPASWGQPEWEAILLHEGAHIARRDHWALLLQRVAIIFYWWCPLAYLVSRRLDDLREHICDDYALQGPCDSIAYAELLVQSAEQLVQLKSVSVPLALFDSARGGLEARVTRLLEKERCPMTHMSVSAKALAFGFLVAGCLMTTAATAFSGAQATPPPQKKVQIKIIVDGKEIELKDAKVLELIEAAQKQGDPAPAIKVAPVDPKVHGRAISPAGKVLVTSDGKVITIIDADSGKILMKLDQASPDAKAQLERYGYAGRVQAKPDPRIEELVKQAEAIKPGSGAEIRKALGGKVLSTPPIYAVPTVPTLPGKRIHEMQIELKEGKKVIILQIEDGTVKQLTEQELKKLIDSNPKFKARETELKKAISEPRAITKPMTPTPQPGELEALRRQLDRINAELQDLRKRLDTGKK